MISRIIDFIRTDIWRIRRQNLPPAKSYLIKMLRILLLALRGFGEDKCRLRASALTFYSLLSIVPVLAMAFGIAQGFGFEDHLQKQIKAKLSAHEEVATYAIKFADSLLENARGGVIAGVGVFLLFWAVIKVLGNIERSFNDIWGVKKSRGFGRKLGDYLLIMFVCPILFILSSSITVFVANQIKLTAEKFQFLGLISPVISAFAKPLPYCIIWTLFSFVYIFMPNTKVNLKSGIVAGIAAGSIYQIFYWLYIILQVGAVRYGAIYGSFAALPLFLVWLQISWLIVLFGAEISFAHQNVETYEFEPDCLRASLSFKKLLALLITRRLVKNFCEEKKPWTAAQISHALETPIRLAREVIYELVEAGVLSETVEEDSNEGAYQPARRVETLTLKHTLDLLEHHGSDDIPVAQSEDLRKISAALETFGELIEKSSANISIKDL